MELVLVRHAQTVDEARGLCYGRLDFALSETGRGQCMCLAERLSGEQVAAVVSSPRLRARDTALAIAELHGHPVIVLDELQELDFGDLEGRPYDEIAATRPELYRQWMSAPTTVSFPGGEGYADLRLRVADAVSQLRTAYEGRLVVAVTHAGVVRAVLADALGMPHDRIFRLAVEPASITRVEWREDTVVVRGFNLTPRDT